MSTTSIRDEALETPRAQYSRDADIATQHAINQSEKHAHDAWRAYAINAVERVARLRAEFTVDAVRYLVERSHFKTHDKRAMGGVIKTAQRNGWISPTGKTVPSKVGHKTPMQIWRSNIYRDEQNTHRTS
jgi:hypothetical protein